MGKTALFFWIQFFLEAINRLFEDYLYRSAKNHMGEIKLLSCVSTRTAAHVKNFPRKIKKMVGFDIVMRMVLDEEVLEKL